MKTSRNLRRVLLTVALVAVVACASIGGTIAWLVDETGPVTNTFTVGDINIDLTETTTDYKMVPGNNIAKDPKVTVLANSEACWLFVKIEESTNLDDFITYAVADGWTALDETNHPGVYYREVAASATDQEFAVLTGNQVTVKESVTKPMMDALKVEGATQPTLTFTAAAVQSANVATVEAAWAKLPTSFTGTVTP